jgi:hypothetical protein
VEPDSPRRQRSFREILGGDPQAVPVVFGYRDPLRVGQPVLALVLIAVLVAVVSGAGRGDFPAFGIVWFGLGSVTLVYRLFAVGHSIRCEGGTIYWRAWFARREVDITAVVASRGEWESRLVLDGARPLRMDAYGDGWDQFLMTLQRVVPDADLPMRRRTVSWLNGYYQEQASG